MKIKEFMTVLWEVNPPPYGDITLDLIINKHNVISESQGGHRLLWLEDNDGRQYIIADYENADKNSFSPWCDQEIDVNNVNCIPFNPNKHSL